MRGTVTHVHTHKHRGKSRVKISTDMCSHTTTKCFNIHDDGVYIKRSGSHTRNVFNVHINHARLRRDRNESPLRLKNDHYIYIYYVTSNVYTRT